MKKTIDEKKLKEMEKWAKYGKLFSGIIHNLNSPIMGVSGRLELIAFKYPDLKGLDKITTQIGKINDILSAIAFLVEKDMNNNEREVDIKLLMTNIDKLYFANMKYKHKMNVETKFDTPLLVKTKPSSLINSITYVIDAILEKCDEDGKISLTYNSDNEFINILISVNQAFIVEETDFYFVLSKEFISEIGGEIVLENNFSDSLFTIKVPKN